MTDAFDYAENILIEALFRNGTLSRPTNWYIALSTTTPAEDGTNITEPGDGNYARQAVLTGASSAWSDPSGTGLTDNSNEIAFPAAATSYGTLTHVVFFDALTVGNKWFFVALDSSVTVGASEVFRFQVGDLDIQVL